MKNIFLGLGSNAGDQLSNLHDALKLLDRLGAPVLTLSPFFETQALTPDRQPDFVNCTCRVESRLSPEVLLQCCLDIEERLGRRRQRHWGPRTIDLDILYFGGWIIRTRTLTVPHPRIHLRRFVLEPLAIIAPGLQDPLSLLTVREMLRDSPDTSWVRRV
jgi:2-amino-4-hydroxy-6-hydroxymethyldihydropteridine diphosphokinase